MNLEEITTKEADYIRQTLDVFAENYHLSVNKREEMNTDLSARQFIDSMGLNLSTSNMYWDYYKEQIKEMLR